MKILLSAVVIKSHVALLHFENYKETCMKLESKRCKIHLTWNRIFKFHQIFSKLTDNRIYFLFELLFYIFMLKKSKENEQEIQKTDMQGTKPPKIKNKDK